VCNSILDLIQSEGGNFNVYDMTKSCEGSLCYAQIETVAQYLSQPEVLSALHVNPEIKQWTACNSSVYTAIATDDWFDQEAFVVPVALDAGIRIQIYAGRNDWICNHVGNALWLSQIPWNSIGEYNAAPHKIWSSADGKTVKGYQQAYGPLSFVSITDAGHMSPADQPANVAEMFAAFLNNQPLTNPPPPSRRR